MVGWHHLGAHNWGWSISVQRSGAAADGVVWQKQFDPEHRKKVLMDFRRQTDPLALNKKMETVQLCLLRYFGTHVSEDLMGSANTSALVEKAQQHLCFPRVLKLKMNPLVTFYCSTVQSMLVVHWMYSDQQEETAEGYKNRWKGDWLSSILPGWDSKLLMRLSS